MIRNAKMEELESILAFSQGLHGSYMSDNLMLRMTNQLDNVFVSEENSKLIGYGVVSNDKKPKGSIIQVGFLPNECDGNMETMLTHLEDHLTSTGCTAIRANVRKKSPEASIYLQKGYSLKLELDLLECPNILEHIGSAPENVREFGKSGIRGVLKTERECFEPHWRMTTMEFLAWQRLEDRIFLVLDNVVAVVGYILINVCEGDSLLSKIAVLPSHQGKGFGSDLLNAGLKWAHDNGASTMRLSTDSNNLKAKNLYKNHGFEAISQELELEMIY